MHVLPNPKLKADSESEMQLSSPADPLHPCSLRDNPSLVKAEMGESEIVESEKFLGEGSQGAKCGYRCLSSRIEIPLKWGKNDDYISLVGA